MQTQLRTIGDTIDASVMGPAYVDEFQRQVLDPTPLFISNEVLQSLEAIPQSARRLRPVVNTNMVVPEQPPAQQNQQQVHPDPLLTFVSLVGLALVIVGLLLQVPVKDRLCFFLEDCHHSNVTRPQNF